MSENTKKKYERENSKSEDKDEKESSPKPEKKKVKKDSDDEKKSESRRSPSPRYAQDISRVVHGPSRHCILDRASRPDFIKEITWSYKS